MRKILTYGGFFESFINTLPQDVVKKIDYGLILLKTQNRIPNKYVKHIKEGLYELRTEWEGNIYRVFFVFDKGNIIVLFNGFHKKGQKTPKKALEKAMRIKQEYEESRK